jgi:hypothetical protein
MIYRIVTYDKDTERVKGNMPIPVNVLSEVKRIAGFRPEDDGLGEYDLNDDQTRQIARIVGFDPHPDRFYYYVEPYEPPEDDGLQLIYGEIKFDDRRLEIRPLTEIFPEGPLLRLSDRSHVSPSETTGNQG